jgi:hypothetical protein
MKMRIELKCLQGYIRQKATIMYVCMCELERNGYIGKVDHDEDGDDDDDDDDVKCLV